MFVGRELSSTRMTAAAAVIKGESGIACTGPSVAAEGSRSCFWTYKGQDTPGERLNLSVDGKEARMLVYLGTGKTSNAFVGGRGPTAADPVEAL